MKCICTIVSSIGNLHLNAPILVECLGQKADYESVGPVRLESSVENPSTVVVSEAVDCYSRVDTFGRV